MIDDYQKNRDLAVDLLSTIKGVTLASPPGAFYCFPKLEGLENSFEFCQKLVTDFKVGFAPGSAFGAGGEGHIRICFAVDQTTLESALNQFKNACKFQS
jgi:aspartate/methionine/tyrosine aminotransferase